MGSCGELPKLIAFGIAPLDIISIGVVPIGVLVTGLHAMEIWSISSGNGPKHHSSNAAQGQLMAYPSRQVALEKARAVRC
jgi:hypothetical protein